MSATETATTAHAERRLARVATLPKPAPGFIGQGHTAVFAIDSREFADNDPFIMLADDRLELPPGRRAGGPHPHAGFEIATFLVEGEARDRDEGLLRAGDVAWMTAGSGVIHNEDLEPLGRLRILQLWMTSPSASRWARPRFEHVAREDAPVHRDIGVEARVYSGTFGSADAGSHTYLPLTMVDVRLAPNAALEQTLPASYAGFLYPLEGDLSVGGVLGGESARTLTVGEIGWLNRSDGAENVTLRLTAGATGARVVLYAGERQNVPIVTQGPFVGESRADLARVSRAFAEGRLPRISELGRR